MSASSRTGALLTRSEGGQVPGQIPLVAVYEVSDRNDSAPVASFRAVRCRARPGANLPVGQVLEPRLAPDVLLDGATRVVDREAPGASVLYFHEWEHPPLDGHAGQVDGLVVLRLPSRRARGQDVDETGPTDRAGLLHLLHQVHRVGHRGGGGVRNPVRRHDGHDVLLGLVLRVDGRCRGRPRSPRRGRRALDPGVHVRFVVVAEVDEILV